MLSSSHDTKVDDNGISGDGSGVVVVAVSQVLSSFTGEVEFPPAIRDRHHRAGTKSRYDTKMHS